MAWLRVPNTKSTPDPAPLLVQRSTGLHPGRGALLSKPRDKQCYIRHHGQTDFPDTKQGRPATGYQGIKRHRRACTGTDKNVRALYMQEWDNAGT